MPILHLDFETRSDVDLRQCGLYAYARGKNTSVLCMAWAFDDGPVQTWRFHEPFPVEVIGFIKHGGEVWAHNAPFEREIWNNCFPFTAKLRDEQLVCTMAMAYATGLPGSLEGAAAALGVEKQKDLEGGRIMRVLSAPREILPDGTPIWWNIDARFERLVAYCAQDVEVERAIGHRMLKLSAKEREIWILDQKINSRGIAVDLEAVKKAIDLVESAKLDLNKKMREVTGNQVATCTATQQIKDYLNYFGVDAESIAKADVSELLANDLHPKAREVLELRSMGAKASTAKLIPMLARAEESGRIQGAFQYSGAGTRRWAGRGVQLQNLKRPSMKYSVIESLVRMIRAGGTAEAIDAIYGPPLALIGDCIRSMLIAGPGKDLIVADFSAIEARVLAWLAGQDNVLDVFRRGEDIYKVAARDIFRVKLEDVTDDQRQVGKVAILALGYQGGVGAFQQMAKGYGVRLAPAYEGLLLAAGADSRHKAQENWESNAKKTEISREEFIASDLVKIAWREANPLIARYWYEAEDAMVKAISNPGAVYNFGPLGREVSFKTAGSFLWCRMPSGGVNCYPYPELKKTQTPWGAEKVLPSYMSEESQSRKWLRHTTYGGSIVENICQSVARDLLAEAMLRLEKAGYPIVAHVHDEIICEREKGGGSLEDMSAIMSQVPSWARGLPLASAGWRGERYRK